MTLTAGNVEAPRPPDAYLSNACFVKSIVFLTDFLDHNPGENGEMLIIALPRPNGGYEGHAMAVFSLRGRLCLYDFELGVIETEINPKSYSAESQRAAITAIYQERSAVVIRAIREGQMTAPEIVHRKERDDAEVARRMLGSRFRAAVVSFNEGKSFGTTFLFDRALWVYLPRLGTGFARVDGKSTRIDLTKLAVGSMGVKCASVGYVETTGNPTSMQGPLGYPGTSIQPKQKDILLASAPRQK